MDSMLEDAARDLFQRLMHKASTHDPMNASGRAAITKEILASGFTDLLLPPHAGGSGIALSEATTLLKLEGYYRVAAPFAQTVVTQYWAHAHKVTLPQGMFSYAATALKLDESAGSATLQKAWHADTAEHMLIASRSRCFLASGHNRTVLQSYQGGLFAAVSWPENGLTRLELNAQAVQDLFNLSVFAMLAATVGAMEKTFEITLDYASQRRQFGRPLSKFQAIQHQISEMAEHVCAADMALQMAGSTNNKTVEIPDSQQLAIAQYQVAHISERIADIAHAIHGAIGISQEYPLHHYTRRIRECKSCFGSQQFWAARIGDNLLNSHHDTLLSALTSIQAGAQAE